MGATVTASPKNDITPAVNAARGKDMAIVFVNAMSGELGFYDTVNWNMGDRNDLKLWYSGDDLVRVLSSMSKANTEHQLSFAWIDSSRSYSDIYRRSMLLPQSTRTLSSWFIQ
jgi:hypothetical protein